MISNIFQVVKEEHLTEILNKNTQKIVLTMYSSKNCNPCKEIKPKFISIAKQNLDCFFVYIDVVGFAQKTGKYIEEERIESTPTFVFYFNGVSIAKIIGGYEKTIVDTLNLLRKKIEIKKQEMSLKELEYIKKQQKELENTNLNLDNSENIVNSTNNINNSHQNIEILSKKIEILNKLRELANTGITLTKSYNIESGLEEMLLEYNFHIQHIQLNINKTNQSSPTPTLTNNQNQNLNQNKKEEQLKQLQDLNKMNQMMQMQQLYKLQQLKQLQQMKEQQEKQDKKDY